MWCDIKRVMLLYVQLWIFLWPISTFYCTKITTKQRNVRDSAISGIKAYEFDSSFKSQACCAYSETKSSWTQGLPGLLFYTFWWYRIYHFCIWCAKCFLKLCNKEAFRWYNRELWTGKEKADAKPTSFFKRWGSWLAENCPVKAWSLQCGTDAKAG